MQSKDVEWILIEDKLKKEWKKQDAYKEEKKEEDKKIINFKDAVCRLQSSSCRFRK
jgi:hypothetical protein